MAYIRTVVPFKYTENNEYTTFFISALPKSFQASLHGLITGGNLVEGVRATMRAGGCNASRGAFIAACFRAMVSESFIGTKPM